MKVFYFAGQAEAFARLVAPLLREHEIDGASDVPVKDHTDLPDEPGNVFVVVQSLAAEIPALFYTALRAKGYTLWHVADSWTQHRLEQDRLNLVLDERKAAELAGDRVQTDAMPRGPASTGPMEG